jgi:hypothetical protein
MQAVAGQSTINDRFESIAGFAAVDSSATDTSPALSTRASASFAVMVNLFDFCLLLSNQMKGWTMKAHEFINSGPPVLLNNPCCCRRVVCSSFLKHAMEVHYG